ncbi:penicillin-binding transpeptidase domain-containing protein, partial [Vibrio sp.]|nr:penicillin-binding transpeptidase domain-containing protein [Vibrio sp.]
ARVASRQPAYFHQLKQEIQAKAGDSFEGNTGLRVFTSLDPVSQQELEAAVASRVPNLLKKGGDKLEAAAIAVDRRTGEIRAMVAGKRVGYDGYNRVLNGRRQVGSLAKPAVYLAALSQPEKYTLATTLDDKPLTLRNKHGNQWAPRNYDRKYRQEVPLYQGLVKSLNIPTVNLGMKVGISEVIDTFEKLGVDRSEIPRVPSVFLGSFTLTPFEVAQMYQTITNQGRKAPLSALRSIVDTDGNAVYRSLLRSSQKVDPNAAWLTTYAMQKAVKEGTGRYLTAYYPEYQLAGKTGTSNDTKDSWFVGVDDREVTTLWVGRDDNRSTGLTGSSGALRVYSEYIKNRKASTLDLVPLDTIAMTGYLKNRNGTLAKNCVGDLDIPVWDYNGQLSENCSANPVDWFKELFNKW